MCIFITKFMQKRYISIYTHHHSLLSFVEKNQLKLKIDTCDLAV